MFKMTKVRKPRDLIVGYIKRAEIGVTFEARKFGQGVMGDVQLLKVGEVGEAGDLRQTI